jgi:predicted P-loop ATPase
MTNIAVKYDGPFDLATGKSRKETHWRNREITWSVFLNRIRETHRTAEKLSEYMSSNKSRQDEIKDIGGYVGGYVNGGRRKKGAVTHRQLITLDIDFGKLDIWEDLTMFYSNAAAVYSTHKHNPDNPRLRLIMPLDRPVSTDEYVAIARRVAGDLNINAFDDTTFEPERLMYWPSTAKDGEYIFKYQNGPWLSADQVLASYRNWKDASEWPVSDRLGKVISREIKKQGDPLEKPGVVGAFCRTYNIHEAIEMFLSDVYSACDVENRYTYVEGSTAAGLVVYDNKFAYSHHGTDPVSGKLCNAFDLVRLHLYSLQDEDAKPGTPGNKLPSYTAMVRFSSKDANVRKQLGIERLQDAREDFAEAYDGEEEVSTDWLGEMDVDGKGRYKSTINNVRLILDNDPSLKNRIATNKFENREVALKDLPWRKIDPLVPYLIDKDDAGIRDYLEKIYDITGVQKVKDAMDLTTEKNSFHPVRDYLNLLEWDQKPRVERLFIDYLGAEDCPYVRVVTRKILTAAVARVFAPGVKFDYVLVLIGKQGIGKSTILKKLGKKWFSDSFGTIQGKEAYEQIQGVWLIEMAELAGLKKAEMETIKHFISKQEDRFRVAYGHRVENFPRQCVFFATTNNRDFLHDPTGNRRFWSVDAAEQDPVKSIWDDLDGEIDQIWAEAVCLFKAGESLFLDRELEKEAYKRQTEHSEEDPRTGLVQQFLDTPLPENWDDRDVYKRRNYFIEENDMRERGVVLRNRISVAEIWCECFGLKRSDMNKYNTKGIHDIMKNNPRWEAGNQPVNIKNYGKQRVYRRVKDSTHEAILVHTKQHEDQI